MLEFTGENEMEQSKDELWPYFTDTDILTECAPGCKEMTLISPHEIEAVMAVGVGSVKPEFDVDVVVTRADRPDVLEMKAVGHAPRNEFETVAEMELKENASGGTTVVWSATADVSGTIASLGGRALKSVTKRLVKKFFSKMQAKADEGVEAESELEAAPEQDATLETDDWSRSFRPTAAPVSFRPVRWFFGPFDVFSLECRVPTVGPPACSQAVRSLGCGENVHSPLGAALSLLGAALPFRAESARAIRAESSNRTANERERRRRVGYCSDSRSFFRRWSGATGI